MINIQERPKSTRKSGEINRFDAHNYEQTIQKLLEKIDKLESKLMLVCKDKYYAISEKEDYENQNKNLIFELESENDKNLKLSNINKENEKKIEELKFINKNNSDMYNLNLKNMTSQIDEHKKAIKNLHKEIDQKNDCIKNYSVDTKIIKQSANNYKNLLNNQIDINKNQTSQIRNLESRISDFSIKKKDESALLLEIELLKKDNLRLLNLLNSTDDYKDFCHLGQTAPLGIRYIKPIEETKAPITKLISKKEERQRTLSEYKKYKANKKKKLEKEDRNWVPLEAYNYLVESKNKFNLDLNNDVIEKLLIILNNFWKERLDREVNHYRAIYQNEIKELKRKLNGKDTSTNINDLLKYTTSNVNNISNKLTKTATTNNFLKKSFISGNKDNLVDDYFFKTAMNARDRRLENEIEILKRKLEEKDNKGRKKRNKILNEGNLIMTGKIIDEIEKLKNKISELFKQYEEKVKYSLDNYENSSFKNKIIDDSVKMFFSGIQNEINSLENRISNWKFNIQRNIDGIDYAYKK